MPQTLSHWGEGKCEKIQFWLPSLIRRGQGGGRKFHWTNPLESPLTKGDTRRLTPKPILSHLREWRLDTQIMRRTSLSALCLVHKILCTIPHQFCFVATQA